MNCAAGKDLIARSVSGNATPADEAALLAHAGACPACADALSRARKLWTLMGRLPAAPPSRQIDPLSLIRPRRRLWIPATAAAALLLAGTLWIAFRPAPAPTSPVVRSTPPAPPSPEQDRVESALDAVVREERHAAPPVPEKAPEPAPKELPVVVRPEPPTPPAPPEKKPEPPAPAPVVKAPEPPPAVEPAPAPKPAAPSRETLPTAATLERADGAVAVINGERTPVNAPFRLSDADGLATLGKHSQAVLAYEDGTRVVLGADCEIGRVLRRRPGEGKRVEILRGAVAAQVGRRPSEDPLVFGTPHADARVLGTRLILLVSDASTRLDVKEGRVRLTRKEDGASVDVGANQYAVAGKGMSMSPRGIPGPKVAVREDFERGRWSPSWAAVVDQSLGITVDARAGALVLGARGVPSPALAPSALPNDPGTLKKQFDHVQRTSALAPKKDWARAGALESKAGFAFSNDAPLRLRLHAWTAKAGPERMVWIGLNRGTPGQGISVERRGDVLRVWVDGAAAALWEKELPSAKEWESLELWLNKERLALRRNGLTVAVLPHPLKGKAAQVTLGICAKAEIAEDEETRIDDLEVAWVTPADFEQISR